MAGDSDSYLTLLQDYHYVLIKSVDPEVFLDYMRQHRVLSEDDCQMIQNHFVHLTRRARMRSFLDILRTKGPDNIHHFFQQLGWEYPHVYREIFRQEPLPAPSAYRQDTKSRLSCDLNQLLTFGLDMKRLRNQKEDLAEQIKDMELMLKHQKNEIEDLERENQRLRQYERDNQQNQERLRIMTTKSEEIKEENRQFLHEIRTLTLEVQKRRDQETTLQAQLDEMTTQIQEKSFELNMKSKEEIDLRAKFEKARKASLRFQSVGQPRSKLTVMVEKVTQARHAARQEDLRQQMEILMDDMKNLEDTNRGLCQQMEYMQNLLDEEKGERDQMHKRVCILEHDKNFLESRQITSAQKIERYFAKIKELEEQKRKMEEERMHMQSKIWEMSQANEKQFEQLHKLDSRYDNLQQSFDQFRQDHRYCVPGEPFDRQRERLPEIKGRPGPPTRPNCHSPVTSPASGKEDDPFKRFTPFYAATGENDDSHGLSGDAQDGGPVSPICFNNPVAMSLKPGGRSGSLTVHVSSSMKKKNSLPEEELDSEDDDCASTLSELSSVSSSTFDPVDIYDARSNMKEEADQTDMQSLAVQEGDILYVVNKGQEHWKVTKVDKVTGKLCSDHHGNIPNPDRFRRDSAGQTIRRPSSDSNSNSKTQTLSRSGAIRRDGLRQHSYVAAYTIVMPMKASRLLPVLLLCPPPAMKSVLSCMETTAQDWADIIPDGHIESSAQLFAETEKHNVLPWDIRPRDPQKYDNNLHKFIILIITLQSQDAVATLRLLLGDPDLKMDYEQEIKNLNERQEMVQRAGLHSETLTVVAGQDNREDFWREVRDKVSQVQHQIFWLEGASH